MENNFKRNKIDVIEHLTPIVKTLKKGALITTKSGDEVNAMTISWGKIGIEWNKLIFTAYIRTGRHTHKMLEENGEFTININPEGKVGKILGFCGTKSGGEINKIEAMNLTTVEGNKVSVPAIAELPLTLECKVVYKQLQDRNAISKDYIEQFYPQDVASDYHSANQDFHTMFYGEIVDAYILEKE
jgi:flavin reductase (DIM6/NTAB) family NADH-FMN oxidoreductase RutF